MSASARLLTALACAALLAGCSRLTAENYDKLQMGMRYEEVVALLGKPERCDDVLTMRNCTWGDDRSHIKVSFVAGQVVLFNAENIR